MSKMELIPRKAQIAKPVELGFNGFQYIENLSYLNISIFIEPIDKVTPDTFYYLIF